ncbi:hypothetical protein OH76DRAFT_1484295 [Lentinus brumalis]|uniref:BTB domain-containing protein n=1 Tax=Lentinus brumalis TaxID=2498619 RepID=A0A371D5M8_9APHY|nr:hypothetical protein OH76DRAFT_1484295 [Polyporus brumalis]
MASQSTATNSPRAPFDDEDADIVFRSCDNVDFRLYRVIIATASRVMHDMLTLPSDPSADAASPPVVPLTETARTLENVFRLCCPVEHPTITTLEDVHAVLEAARKYEMPAVTANLRWVIKLILPKEPLRVYGIAYMLEMEDVAREAAKLLLEEPSLHLPTIAPPEFQVIPALAIHTVHVYRQKCVEAALRAVDDLDWVLNGDHERARLAIKAGKAMISWCWISDPNYNDHAASCAAEGSIQLKWTYTSHTGGRMQTSYSTRRWFVSHVDAIKSALASRPLGQTVRTHLADGPNCEILSEALSCHRCRPAAYVDLTLFDTLLAGKVDAAVDKVKLDLPFARRVSAPKRK